VALARFTKLMAASLPTVKRLVMMGYGRAPCIHLITGCRLSSVKTLNQLQSVRSAQGRLIVFMIAQSRHVTHLIYSVQTVLKI